MSNSSPKKELSTKARRGWFQGRSMAMIMLAVCLLVAGIVVLKITSSRVGNSLFFLLLLACPLLHFFMHRGHGDEGHRDQHGPPVGANGDPSKNGN